MNKKKKYYAGGKINSIENPSTAIFNAQTASVKAQQEASSDPWVVGLKAIGNMAMQYGMSKINSSGQGQQSSQMSFQNGGVIPERNVEVEGQEAFELPNGISGLFQGPSHEKGGIDINLPVGTDIYSKRIKGEDGKTMAKRKIARQKAIDKIERALKKDPTNKLLKKSLEKVQSNNEFLDEKDMAVQEVVNQVLGSKEKYATGGQVGTGFGNFLRNIFGAPVESQTPGLATPGFNGNTYLDHSSSIGVSDDASIFGASSINEIPDLQYQNPYITSNSNIYSDPNKSVAGNNLAQFKNSSQSFLQGFGGDSSNQGSFSAGDIASLAGNIYNIFNPENLVKEQRAGDTPNINAFKDFGQDALQANEKAKGQVQRITDNARKDLQVSRRGTTNRLRGTARGVNQLRALDLATNQQFNDSIEDLYANQAAQLAGLYSQQAQLENQQDQAVMSGEQLKDLNDRKDRDNYYTQLLKAQNNKGEGLQHLGKNLNTSKGNRETNNILNQLFENYNYNHKTKKFEFKKS